MEVTMFLTQSESESMGKTENNRYNNFNVKAKSSLKAKYHKISNDRLETKIISAKKTQYKNLFLLDNIRQQRTTNPETKWKKIVDLYNIPNQQCQSNQKVSLVKQGPLFYHILSNQQILKKYKLKINFPQTFFQISGDLIFIKTNPETGYLEASKIQKDRYQQIMQQTLIKQNQFLKQHKLKYKQHYDIKFNVHAPVIVTKVSEEKDTVFQVDVQSYKNFLERRSRPSANKIIQRFVYPRNMRAIIMRICYFKLQRGEQRGQFYAYRFQNVDNIFRINKKNSQIYQTFKLQSTISAAYDRENKIQYSKIINMKGLQKYIQPSNNLIKFLQQSQKIKINKIFIDYVVDLFDRPWLINIKRINYQQNKSLSPFHSLHISTRNSLHTAGSYGICRLCSIQYEKKYLKKSISNKMLIQFLSHLKKRMKVQNFEKIGFVNQIIKKNTKNYISLQVCQSCYKIVAQQYKLIQSEFKLATICSISPKLQVKQVKSRPITFQTKSNQWRLMLYFVSLQNIPTQLVKQLDQVLLKYSLGNDGIEYCWKIDTSYNLHSNGFKGDSKVYFDLKKIKIHYFYSNSSQIDTFLKQTQISLQLNRAKSQKVFAKGSSGTLSTFCGQFHPQLCLRQTSSVLLFYQDGKYCQLNMKIGLIYDGVYEVPENVSLIPVNKVYFTDNNFTNSNPIPKQWMQAFGVNHQILIDQVSQSNLVSNKVEDQFLQFATVEVPKTKQNRNRNKFARKSLHLLR